MIAAVAVLAWLVMAWWARYRLQRLEAEVGYRFPRVHGVTGRGHR